MQHRQLAAVQAGGPQQVQRRAANRVEVAAGIYQTTPVGCGTADLGSMTHVLRQGLLKLLSDRGTVVTAQVSTLLHASGLHAFRTPLASVSQGVDVVLSSSVWWCCSALRADWLFTGWSPAWAKPGCLATNLCSLLYYGCDMRCRREFAVLPVVLVLRYLDAGPPARCSLHWQ
jgi:hypothetical protein